MAPRTLCSLACCSWTLLLVCHSLVVMAAAAYSFTGLPYTKRSFLIRPAGNNSFRRRHVDTQQIHLLRASTTTPEISLLTRNTNDTDHDSLLKNLSASQDVTIDSETNYHKTKKRSPKYDLPWTESQEWALRDNLAKYTVQVPISSTTGTDEDGVVSMTMGVFTLWRTLSSEVVELSGYPLSFLVDRQMELQKAASVTTAAVSADSSSSSSSNSRPAVVLRTSRTILPYLDDYEFTPMGGLRGAVYGVQGVADGTRIETTPVGDVERTLPLGFVRTQCASSVVYELGKPRVLQTSPSASPLSSLPLSAITQPLSTINNNLSNNGGEPTSLSVLDPDLVNLGALTAVVTVGALAFETLSRHLTVNVFWV